MFISSQTNTELSFYTGFTNNIVRRVLEHKTKVNRGFTNKYNCDELLYFEQHQSMTKAMARELELKRFRRDFKFQMITKMNPGWKDLSEGWYE